MAFSKELLEALAEFDKLCPMKCEIVGSQAELDAAVERHQAEGRRLACVSNAGLRPPQMRITFLAADAFTDEPVKREPKEPVDVREWVKQFTHPST